MGESVSIFNVCVCVCVHVKLQENKGGRGGYILVMLTEFYKLWLTPLPTAD